MDLLGPLILTVIIGAIAYGTGKERGRCRGVDEVFDPFYSARYYNGRIARHSRTPLKGTRSHPELIKKLVPTLRDPNQELSRWSLHADHLTFEGFRQRQVADLNVQLQQDVAKGDARQKA